MRPPGPRAAPALAVAARLSSSRPATAELVDRRSLTYGQPSADAAGRRRLTRTHITDPASATVLVDVDFRPLAGSGPELYAPFGPRPAGDSGHGTSRATADPLTAVDTHLPDRPVAAALVPGTGFTATSTGYTSTSEGLAGLTANSTPTSRYRQAGLGSVAQLPTGRDGTARASRQRPDGSFSQNSEVDGTPDHTDSRLDETAFPIPPAWQTKRFDAAFHGGHGDRIRFVTRVAGTITSPRGGNGVSVQRVDILLHDPSQATGTSPGRPGTNTATAGTWQRAVVADGRHADPPLPLGVHDPAPTKLSAPEPRVVPAGHDIVVTVPASALGLDVATARRRVATYSDAESGEGIGLVRPVHSEALWDNGFPWAEELRSGGGAGEQSFDVPGRDPDTIDVITGDVDQSAVLDRTTTSPVVPPFVDLRAP
ncbi:glucodextranase DOMON-like domain-containing protein [Saccharothrix texasensis]|uniref:Glucodextranase-like protein n=1 Tax=Saccharothrix texasensis TaxID=103734 RepID=A0A3N1GXQ8_9PSEU|nr:glucodextranase DOMON-like domain-containing protein [Saccharothrix texasensis]ROP35060.1 glucodextranase-like protein [Saccharothrix texasensis]